MHHWAIKFENWKVKNKFLIFNFAIKNGNWRLKNFYHFLIFNFELKIETCKYVLFFNMCKISILNWKMNGTFGARITFQFNCQFFIISKLMKIGFGEFSIRFLIFRMTEKMKNWLFGNFQSVFNSLHNGKSNSMCFDRTLHCRIWFVDPIMTSEF